jgi:RHS repeat-associated protein
MRTLRLALFTVLAVVATTAVAGTHKPKTLANGDWESGLYQYDGSGNIWAVGADQYVYDTAGRLVSGTPDLQHSGFTGTQQYSYDSFGNLQMPAPTNDFRCVGRFGSIDCSQPLTIEPLTNHIKSNQTGYDDAGNVTAMDGSFAYQYDPVGMMARQTGDGADRSYIYTASDERIAVYSAAQWEWSVRDLNGKVLRELTSTDGLSGGFAATNWSWREDSIYRQSLLLASESAAGRRHFHLDHLGSPRLITDDGGRRVGVHSYLPFGGELDLSLRETPLERHQFTGHERDDTASVHSLDYMHARYYGAAVGRFFSSDPVLGEPSRPQTWNRYSYATNNPVSWIDPKGMYETNCGKDLECQWESGEFEGARLQDLQSRNAATRAGAAAYGEPGQTNGVVVNFGATTNGTPAETGASTAWVMDMAVGPPASDGTRYIGAGKATPLWAITVTFDGEAAITPGNVAHEGVHVSHALPFFRSWNGVSFDDSLRVTTYFTESAAYNVTATFTPRHGTLTIGGSHVFRDGMSAAQRQAVVDSILRDPSMGYKVSPTNQGGSWPP